MSEQELREVFRTQVEQAQGGRGQKVAVAALSYVICVSVLAGLVSGTMHISLASRDRLFAPDGVWVEWLETAGVLALILGAGFAAFYALARLAMAYSGRRSVIWLMVLWTIAAVLPLVFLGSAGVPNSMQQVQMYAINAMLPGSLVGLLNYAIERVFQ